MIIIIVKSLIKLITRLSFKAKDSSQALIQTAFIKKAKDIL